MSKAKRKPAFWTVAPGHVAPWINISGMSGDEATECVRKRVANEQASIGNELVAISGKNAANVRVMPVPDAVREIIEQQLACVDMAAVSARTADEKRRLIATAMEAGFTEAVHRYFDALKDVPELKQLQAAEQTRKATAISGKREAMLARAREAEAMVDRGDSIADVAAHFEVDKSRVYAWLRELQKQRV